MVFRTGASSAWARLACATCALLGTAVLFAAPASAAPARRAHSSVACRAGQVRWRHGHAARHHGHHRRHHRGNQARRRRAHCSVRSLRRSHQNPTPAARRAQPSGVDLASLAAASCPNTTLQPQPGNLDSIRGSIFCLINRERARNGENPLRSDAHLRAAAQHHSDDMVAREYFEHEGPGGETLLDRLHSSGYLYSSRIGYVVGENIAWGTLSLATPKAIVEAWMTSPGHRANILDASFHDTGIGVAPSVPRSLGEGQPGATYTQDFGVVITG